MAGEIELLEKQFTKYEIARILGARALQIAMDAPLLLNIDEKELENINYNPIEIAKRELVEGVLPITINRPLPKRKEVKIKMMSKEEIELIKQRELEAERKKEDVEQVKEKLTEKLTEINVEKSDKKEEENFENEEVEEKKVTEYDEIMELSTPEDEVEETTETTEAE